MERTELLDCLLDLAGELGIAVRRHKFRQGVTDEPLPRTGLCRVRGEAWLLVMEHEPIEDRIAAVAGALRESAPAELEGRYLPPRIREAIDPSGASPR